jgi:hypothetical protein
MRSDAVASLLLAFAVLWAQPTAQAQTPELASRAEVEAAAKRVRQDPNMPGTEKRRELEFKKSDDVEEPDEPEDEPDEARKPPKDDSWMKGFAEWLNSAGRVVMWVVGGVLVAFLLVGLRHWIRVRAESRVVGMAPPPSHVRDLDIRPQSLPDSVGVAARKLWERGEHRPALSLLYRGALSRLVHGHGVAIRAASTEGDCLRLARERLDSERGAYFERMVSAWQLAVYGGRLPTDEAVFALCDQFDAQLGAQRLVAPAAEGVR